MAVTLGRITLHLTICKYVLPSSPRGVCGGGVCVCECVCRRRMEEMDCQEVEGDTLKNCPQVEN